MMGDMINKPIIWLGILVGAAILIFLARRLVVQSRERRRRTRSYGKVVSSKRGLWVRLAVRARKPRSNQPS